MKKLLLTLTLILLCNIGFAQNAIDSRLQEVLNQKSDEMIPVNIVFKSQIDLAKLRTRAAATLDKNVKRDMLVDELKLFSEERQQEVLSILKAETRSSKVTNIKTHWLSNAISCTASSDVIYLLSKHPDVEVIGYDEMVKMVPEEGQQTTVNRQQTQTQTQTQTNDTDVDLTDNIYMVNADKVWAMGYTGKGVLVAVIDSGVNYNHEDLKDHLWDGGAQYPNHGYNTVNDNDDTMDRYGHGTHCAGTICGDGTAGILTGMAPDATLMCVKALDDYGSGSTSSINSAMEFAIEHHADILSMSLGILAPSAANKTLLRNTCVNALELGVVASVAAGNFGTNMTPQMQVPNNILAPASCPPPWLHPDQQVNPGGLSCVVAVGAVDYFENMYSNGSKGPVTWTDTQFNDYPYGGDKIGLIRPDVCAPGVGVKSLDYSDTQGYNLKSGTSMAAPCVAGVMALMLEKNANLSPADICMTLETTAKKLTETKDNFFGTGLIDAFKAVNSIKIGDFSLNKVSINDKDANNNGHLNPGEYVRLSVSVHNDSEKEYNNIKAVISCSNEYVTIADAEANIDNIAGNANVMLKNEFGIAVSKDIEHSSELFFNLDFYENETVISSTIFSLEVKDSELIFASFLVKNDDNDNGILEAGETADLGVVLNNIGNEIAVKVKGNLSSDKITVNKTEAEFSSIGGNASSVAFFNITVSEDLGSSIPFTLKATDLYGREYEFSENYTLSCNYIFQLSDSYSDGWNGAALLVKYDSGRPTDTLTLKSGGFGEFRLNIESNVEVTLEWMGKDQYDKECSFIVMKDNYVAVYMSPTLSQTSSFLCSWVNDCSCKYEYQEMCDAVKDLKGEFAGNDIVLNWTADNGQTVFEVYRGTVLVGTTEETSFTESGLSGKEYVYSVRAIYDDCNGLFSDVTVKNTESTIENTAIEASIYPNPSRDNFTIVCNDMTYVTVYNVVGNKIMEANVDGSNYVINGLESGVYFVEIKTNEGNLVKRILKI